MLKQFFITVVIFSMILYGACSDKKTITKNAQPVVSGEYIILFGAPNIAEEEWAPASDEEDYFSVINISNDETTEVPAVVELEGKIYLPTMSRSPSFNNKVVEGYFVPDTNYFEAMTDTIFRVTKHLRDTSTSSWGG
jgi:hypothetical protein